ncbi:guanine nucleotide exchange factor MSS4 homolog [Tetranychus urticae]|nr:guanine nucleotide exchange factor MSS4 homolog [Tetranychus urticae]
MSSEVSNIEATKMEQAAQSDVVQFNESKIICKKCSCLILRPKQAKFIEKKIELPVVATRKDEDCVKEVLNNHLLVESIYTYENMGFSNTVEGVKYLVCAECEYGPVGCMNNNEKTSFLSLDRVIQEKE